MNFLYHVDNTAFLSNHKESGLNTVRPMLLLRILLFQISQTSVEMIMIILLILLSSLSIESFQRKTLTGRVSCVSKIDSNIRRGSPLAFSHRELNVSYTNEPVSRNNVGVIAPDSIGLEIYEAAAAGRSQDLKTLCAEWEGNDIINYHNPEYYSSTPVLIASKNGHPMCLQSLIDAGGDVNIADSMGESPAMHACKMNHANCLSIIIQTRQANLNLRSRIGATAAYWASFRGNSKCLKLLIDCGDADVTIPNSFGVSPLQLAIREGHSECVSILELHNSN